MWRIIEQNSPKHSTKTSKYCIESYVDKYGWHFNSKLCDYACNRMYKKDINGKSIYIPPYKKSDVDEILNRYNVHIADTNNYDYVYIANMCKADFLTSSISDEYHLALFIKDYIGDSDGYDGIALTRYYADCMATDVHIPWEDIM